MEPEGKNGRRGMLDWVLDLLEEQGLLTNEIEARVREHRDIYNLYFALSKLKENGALTQTTLSLILKHKDPRSLVEAITYFKRHKLLTPDILLRIAEHKDPKGLVQALRELKDSGVFSRKILYRVLEHENPPQLAEAFIYLSDEGLLTDEMMKRVAEHSNPSGLARALIELKKYGLLKDPFLSAVLQHEDPANLAYILTLLKDSSFLTDEVASKVLGHKDVRSLLRGLLYLEYGNFLREPYLSHVLEHEDPEELALAIRYLNDKNLLDGYLDLVAKHERPYSLAKALVSLRDRDLLNPDILARVFEHKDPEAVAKNIIWLHQKGLQDYPPFSFSVDRTRVLWVISLLDRTFHGKWKKMLRRFGIKVKETSGKKWMYTPLKVMEGERWVHGRSIGFEKGGESLVFKGIGKGGIPPIQGGMGAIEEGIINTNVTVANYLNKRGKRALEIIREKDPELYEILTRGLPYYTPTLIPLAALRIAQAPVPVREGILGGPALIKIPAEEMEGEFMERTGEKAKKVIKEAMEKKDEWGAGKVLDRPVFVYTLPGTWKRVQELEEDILDPEEVEALVKKYGGKEEYVRSFASRLGFTLALLYHFGLTLSSSAGSSLSPHNVTADGIVLDLDTSSVPGVYWYNEAEARKNFKEYDFQMAMSRVADVAEKMEIDRSRAREWFNEAFNRTLEILRRHEVR